MATYRKTFANSVRVTSLLGAALLLLAGCNNEASDRIGEWRKAEIREACFGAMEKALHNSPRLPTRDHRIDLRTQVRGEEMKTALHCYVVTNQQAVCEKHNRAYIVDYIGRYYRFVNEMYRTAEEYGEKEKRTVEAFWDDWRGREIKVALEDHILKGRLIAGDFSWSKPAQLAGLLDKYKGARDWCAKT